jgi:uncharacterized protein YjaG (DUF416 family)
MVEVLVMTNLSFDPARLKSRLSRLPQRHALAFGVWQLERMIPNFLEFCIEESYGGVWILRCAVVCGWSVVETGSKNLLEGLTADMCNEIAPDTELFESKYVSSALDTATAAGNMIDYVKTNDVSLIVDMASLARDSADVFIQLSSDCDPDSIEDSIITHPLMQKELQYQEADVTFLESISKSDSLFPAVLARSLSEQYGKKWL